jgi:small-conductance mechanosensitive channel
MRYTRITTNDAVDILVPNSEFINGKVTNWTFNDRNRRIRVPFGVAYGSDKNVVREAGIAAAASVNGLIIDDAHPVSVLLRKFGDSTLDFELLAWVGSELIAKPGGTSSRILWALEDELTKRGIEIPNPQRDIHVRSGTLAVSIERPENERDERETNDRRGAPRSESLAGSPSGQPGRTRTPIAWPSAARLRTPGSSWAGSRRRRRARRSRARAGS